MSVNLESEPCVMIATESALWGSIQAHGLLPNAVIVSDDAGQFNVGAHGLCWVHYLEYGFISSRCRHRQHLPMVAAWQTPHKIGPITATGGRRGGQA
jgi:hypothetical protein